MFSDLNVFKIASALAQHSTTRQKAVSQNIANADTPNYKAVDIVKFSDAFQSYQVRFDPRAQVVNEFRNETSFDFAETKVPISGNEKPNGNSVSLETEMMKSAENQMAHQMALTAYKYGLDVIRTSLGRGR